MKSIIEFTLCVSFTCLKGRNIKHHSCGVIESNNNSLSFILLIQIYDRSFAINEYL